MFCVEQNIFHKLINGQGVGGWNKNVLSGKFAWGDDNSGPENKEFR